MTFDQDLRFTSEHGGISSPRPNIGMNTQPSSFKQTDSSPSPSSIPMRSGPTTNAPHTTKKQTHPSKHYLCSQQLGHRKLYPPIHPTTNFNIRPRRLSFNSTLLVTGKLQ